MLQNVSQNALDDAVKKPQQNELCDKENEQKITPAEEVSETLAEIPTQKDIQTFENDPRVKKQVLLFNLRHLAFDLCNLSIVCVSFILLLILGQFVTVLVAFLAAAILFVFLIFISVVTVGVVYATTDIGKMWGWFGSLTDGSSAFLQFLQKLLVCTPYVCAVGIVAAVGSIICYSFSKNYKSTPRIVVSGIMIGLCVIGIIFYFAGVMK